jgi:hypothetical protein
MANALLPVGSILRGDSIIASTINLGTSITASNGIFPGGVTSVGAAVSALNLTAGGVGGGVIQGSNLVISSINGAAYPPGGGGGGGFSTFRVSSINAYSTGTTSNGNLWINSNAGNFQTWSGSNWFSASPLLMGQMPASGIRWLESGVAWWVDVQDRSARCIASNGTNVLSLQSKVGPFDAMFPGRGMNISTFNVTGFLSTFQAYNSTQALILPFNTYTSYMSPYFKGVPNGRNQAFTCATVGVLTSLGNTNSFEAAWMGMQTADSGTWTYRLRWNGSSGAPAPVFHTITGPQITSGVPFVALWGIDPVAGAFLRVNGSNTLLSTITFASFNTIGCGTAQGPLAASQFWQTCHGLFEGIVWPYSLFQGNNNSNAFTVVEGALAHKYNLLAQLPVTHPFKAGPPAPGSWII